MSSMRNRITEYARSPQGQQLVQRVQRYAERPENQRRLQRVRAWLAARSRRTGRG